MMIILEKLRQHRKTFYCCMGYLLLLGVVCLYNFHWTVSNKAFSICQGIILCIFLVLIVIISCIIAINYYEIEKLPDIQKKHAVLFSGVTFFTYRMIFLIKHQGYFSFDEFYHISTLNPDYVTGYNRAPYINGMVKILCRIWGQSDFIVKLVPFILGSISFLCGLYLLYNIYDNSYWIIIISFVLTFMPYMANNHFYIRMYVFLEAVFMVNSVLFYNAGKKEKGGIRNIVLAFILTISYALNTNDSSAKAILLVMIAVSVYYFLGKKIISLFSKYFIVRVAGGIFFICCLCIILYLVAIKQHWIESSLLESETVLKILGTNLETFYHADSPVFLKFIFLRNFYISIPFLLSFIYIWRQKNSDKEILFVISILPLSGYMVLLYNSYLLRTYMAFFPIVCIVAYLAFEKFKLSNLQYWAIILGVLALTLNGTKDFWNVPGIAHETGASNVGDAIKIAKSFEKQGYEIVSLMSYKTQAAYFDLLDIDLNLNKEDVREGLMHERSLSSSDAGIIANELISDELEEIFNSDKQRVIVADNVGLRFLRGIKWEESGRNIELREIKGNTGVVIIN